MPAVRKILIVGHARHGKDTVAEIISDYIGASYKASSEICAEFIMEAMNPEAGYKTVKDCFEDRVNHRARWHNIIKDYCANDKARLGSLIFDSNLIYCGVRDSEELLAILEQFDPLVLWVEDGRKPSEPASSMNISYDSTGDIFVANDGTLAQLKEKVLEIIVPLYPSKWTTRFMQHATQVAGWSKDPSYGVGCVIVSPDKNESVTGFNGLPRGIEDSSARLLDKRVKNALTVHAEVNAIINSRRKLTGWTLYCTKPPCLACACAIIQAGIVAIVCPELVADSSWFEEQLHAKEVLKEAGIVSKTA